MVAQTTDTALDALHALTGRPDVDVPRAPARGDRRPRRATARRVLCVQRTGWGKSAVYFVATALLRDARRRADAARLARCSRSCATRSRPPSGSACAPHTINSTNRDDWDAVRDAARRDDAVDLLLICPERLNNPQFRERDAAAVRRSESGCSSSTRRTASPTGATTSGPTTAASATCSPRCRTASPCSCTTATANDRVVADVAEQLGVGAAAGAAAHLPRPARPREPAPRGGRPPAPGRAARLARATHLPQLPGSGIVYTLTKRDTELVAEWLTAPRHRAPGLHRRGRRPRTASRSRTACCATSVKSRRRDAARSAWATTSPTSASSCTTRRRARRSPTTSRSAAPAAASTRATRAAARRRGPAHPGLLHRAGLPGRASTSTRVLDPPRRRRPAGPTMPELGARQPRPRRGSRRC